MNSLSRIMPKERAARVRWTCLLLALVTCATYWSVWRHGFINFDDPMYVSENALVQKGLSWDGVIWAFTTGHAINWHPVTWLSHMLDCQLFGLDPGAHHMVNVLLHTVDTGLLFLVLLRLTGALKRSALVAALFAVHPLHIESVAWIAERKDVLSTLFWFLTLWAYVAYTERPTIVRYGLMLLLFALGLMSKPMLVTLPFVLLLLDYWPLRRWQWFGAPALTPEAGLENSKRRTGGIGALILEKTPLLGLAAVSCFVTFLVQRHEAVISVEKLSHATRVANAVVSYGRYLGKMLWPTDLAIYYPHPGSWPLWVVAVVALLLAAVSFWVWRSAVHRPYLLVGWLWYLGTLVPVIGLVQVGSQSIADRYTYIPLTGIFIMLAWGMADLAERWQSGRGLTNVLATGMISLCAVLTWNQLSCWQNSLTLFRHTLAVTRNNAMAHNMLGDALVADGKPDEALQHYAEAIRIRPGLAGAHNNLGTIWLGKGQPDAAAKCFAKAVELQPNNANAHNNLGLARAQQGRLDAAREDYLTAVKLAPNYAQAHSNLGGILLQLNHVDEAISHLRTAVKLNPTLAEAYYNLAIALAKQGKIQEALDSRTEAIRLNPKLGGK